MAGVYVHFPFCRSKCAYCDFASYPGREALMAPYCQRLLAELAARRGALSGPVGSVYFGGGTPTALPADLLCDTVASALGRLELAANAEITLEANPGTVDGDTLARLRGIGVNRLSLGLQSADDALLARLGRIHRYADFRRAYEAARRAGFDNISVDLMFALPGQSRGSLAASLAEVIALGPEHISCYCLRVEPGTPFAQQLAAGSLNLPGEDEAADMLALVRRTLAGASYDPYEISNFCRPGRASRHNLTYWRGGEYLGVGCAAASFLAGARTANTPDLAAYLAADDPTASAERPEGREAMFEFVMLGMRLKSGLDMAEFSRRFGMTPRQAYPEQIAQLTRAGLLAGDGVTCLKPTERGVALNNQLLLPFLDYR